MEAEQGKSEKILIVGKDEELLLSIQKVLLQSAEPHWTLDWAPCTSSGKERLRAETYQAVLIDDALGESDCLDLIRTATGQETHSALILLTQSGNPAAGLAALRAGASFYFMKSEFTIPLLKRSIRYAQEIKQKDQGLLRAALRTEDPPVSLPADTLLQDRGKDRHARDETLYHLAIQAVMGVVYDWDLKSNEVFQSIGLAQVVGYQPGEEPQGEGRWWPRNIHPEDYARVDAELQATLDSQKNSFAYEYRIRHANGNWVTIWDQGYIVRDDRGQALRVVGVCTDITKRKLAEEELRKSEIILRESENRFRTSVESLLDGFAILSAVRKGEVIVDFCFEYINETGCRMNRRSYEEQVGQHLLALQPEQKENGLYDKYVQLVVNGQSLEEEVDTFEALPAGGQRLQRSFEVRAVKLGDGFVITWRNITRRKQTEEQLKIYAEKLAQSNKELEQFAFVASHDLQEPLRKIKMFGNILHKQLHGQLSDQSEEYLMRMQSASARMEQMIQGLLELSRVSTRGGSFTQVDLTAAAQDALSDLEPRLVGSAGQVIIEPLPTIQADVLQMRQLFQNILSNGLKFHKKGTPPVVRISSLPDSPADHVILEIEDNGIGFEVQFADRIFQPFHRLHGRSEFEGSGMGLAICQRIVERHHGTITVHSQPGSGTTFRISLPVQHL